MEEIWRTIPTWDKYEASNTGKIRNKETKQELKQSTTRGYPYVGLWRDGATNAKRKFVHGLVAQAFLPVTGTMVRHIDDDRTNNHLDNLCWGTAQDNYEDRVKNGRDLKGEDFKRKLKNEDVREILRLKGQVSQRELGIRYGVHQVTVSEIHRGKIWRHIHAEFV